MTRFEAFLNLQTHPWHKRNFEKLNDSDISFALSFLQKSELLDKDDFQAKINRMYLDMDNSNETKASQKRRLIVQELLSNANTVAFS